MQRYDYGLKNIAFIALKNKNALYNITLNIFLLSLITQ